MDGTSQQPVTYQKRNEQRFAYGYPMRNKEESNVFNKVIKLVFVLAIIATPGFAALTTSAAPLAQDGNAERGQYIFSLVGGCGCHMGEAGFLAGGRAPNITPDPETGIGGWSQEQIVMAIRTVGRHPGGFTFMAQQDAYDLAAYIQSVPPVQNQVERRGGDGAPNTLPEDIPETAPTEGIARGEYIVTRLANCQSCHTPRNEDGTLDMSRFLGGTMGEGGPVKNLTPHPETGLTWTQEQIATFLLTGIRPDGTVTSGGRMAHLIEEGYQYWSESDAMAVGAYLKTLEPVPFMMPEQPPAEQPPAEQPPAEHPPAEQPPAEQPPAEQPPAMEEEEPSFIIAVKEGEE
jgi:mono/diheme cytochrome c family protein